MIIVGAQGFAKEVLDIVISLKKWQRSEIVFFDNINLKENHLYEFPILHSEKDVSAHFLKFGKEFTLGMGNPLIRKKLNNLFLKFGGKETSLTSPKTTIGNFDTTIGKGTIICEGSIITNSVKIGNNCLINLNTTIGHDSSIGNFVEICPNVSISGNCIIGEGSFIGTGAILLPGITLGKYVTVGAGTVVTKNFPDESKIVGIPSKLI